MSFHCQASQEVLCHGNVSTRVSNLLSHLSSIIYNVFCSFPQVSVVNMVHRQRKGSNVRKSSFGGRTKTQV